MTAGPTIDAGTAAGLAGLTDPDGNTRTIGAAPDIGAYELAPPATPTTGPSSAISTTDATLGASVNPNGGATSAYLEYGTGFFYDHFTPGQALGNGFAPVPISAAVSGLTPGTVYHYNVVAYSSAGVSIGTDMTFTTAAAPTSGGGGPGRGGAPSTGASPGPTGPAHDATAVAPHDSALRLRPAAFIAAGSATAAARRRVSRRTGTTVSYVDSKAATTTFTIERVLPGARRGRSCAASPKRRGKSKRVKRCTRRLKVGSFAHRDVAGANRLRFSGRVGGRKLAPGSYAITALPRNADGRPGGAAHASFRIVRR